MYQSDSAEYILPCRFMGSELPPLPLPLDLPPLPAPLWPLNILCSSLASFKLPALANLRPDMAEIGSANDRISRSQKGRTK